MAKNERLITVTETATMHGYDDYMDLLEDAKYDSMCPACCKDGCEVEQDGQCEHGCPSVMIALGLI